MRETFPSGLIPVTSSYLIVVDWLRLDTRMNVQCFRAYTWDEDHPGSCARGNGVRDGGAWSQGRGAKIRGLPGHRDLPRCACISGAIDVTGTEISH